MMVIIPVGRPAPEVSEDATLEESRIFIVSDVAIAEATTFARLLPINTVTSSLCGLDFKRVSRPELRTFFSKRCRTFKSESDINAISAPEKKAEKKMRTARRINGNVNRFLPFFSNYTHYPYGKNRNHPEKSLYPYPLYSLNKNMNRYRTFTICDYVKKI